MSIGPNELPPKLPAKQTIEGLNNQINQENKKKRKYEDIANLGAG